MRLKEAEQDKDMKYSPGFSLSYLSLHPQQISLLIL
jgi:hypothetical protein